LREDLPLVPAPAGWESTLCTTSGVDFGKLVDSSGGDLTDMTNHGTNFADSFIGDYVTKLENVVESYRLVNNFHEGSDVSVISLRDDVLNVRKDCSTTSTNLLFHSAKLDFVQAGANDTQHNWFPDGCQPPADGGVSGPCVSSSVRKDTPFSDQSSELSSVAGYTLHFGCGASADCSWQAGAALVQKMTLQPGRYRFSWFSLVAPAEGGVDPAVAQAAGIVRSADGVIARLPNSENSVGAASGWRRYFFSFELNQETDVVVGFTKTTTGDLPVSAPMLESVQSALGTVAVVPRPFSKTDDTLTSVRPVCEDTDGAVFRRTRWTRSCVKLCPDGYSSNCESRAKTECYRETSFQLSQRGLEEGAILNQSGFARGNFNYRIDTIGLNFVGTGVRNCTDSTLPSTCFGGGFVPYSLEHEGPYLVRNHKGEDFRAELFTGHIEHARGLGTERYLTNPLSSADRTLLQDYLRTELQGRPLDGTFVLRIWESGGVDFDAIQDVQLVLNYRYWTRFN
jgi:hypothetical protein